MASTSSADPLRVGPLEIDRAAREITVRGQRRELTGREYQLLLLLAESCRR
jgi:DNA-binding response OmpR family regulator